MAQASEARGKDALRRHPAPGAQSKLSAQQRAELPSLLKQGAQAFGFRGEVWTAQRVAKGSSTSSA